jgi:hypothetical protein
VSRAPTAATHTERERGGGEGEQRDPAPMLFSSHAYVAVVAAAYEGAALLPQRQLPHRAGRAWRQGRDLADRLRRRRRRSAGQRLAPRRPLLLPWCFVRCGVALCFTRRCKGKSAGCAERGPPALHCAQLNFGAEEFAFPIPKGFDGVIAPRNLVSRGFSLHAVYFDWESPMARMSCPPN